MAAYDYVDFTPQASDPASPAKNEIWYRSSEDRLYCCPDGTGAGGGAVDDLRFVPQASDPTPARGRVWMKASDKHLYVYTSV